MHSLFSYDDADDQKLSVSELLVVDELQIGIKAGTVAGSPDKPNEDSFAAMHDKDTVVVAVFDGATSLKPSDVFGEQTGARYASHFLKEQLTEAEREDSPAAVLSALNDSLRKSYEPLGLDISDPSRLPAAVATVVRITPDLIDFAHAGDTFGIVFYRDGTSALFTQDEAPEAKDPTIELIAQIASERGITPREAREDERVKQALVERRIARHNNPDGSGIGVLNGDPNLQRYIRSGTIVMEEIEFILVGSDGLLPPGWSLDVAADRQKLLSTIQNGGFEHLFGIKHAIEDKDPDWNFIRYKHSDDATGVLMSFA